MRCTMPLVLSALLLAGCGGGGGSHSPAGTVSGGRAILTVQWPERTRLIPAAANSLVVTISSPGVADQTKLIVRPSGSAPTSTTQFTGLKYGAYSAVIKAYPTADGTGVAQAAGGRSMTVSEDAPGAVTVSLVSTAATLELPQNVAFDKGATTMIAATAKDAQGNVVLLSAGGGAEALAWSVDGPTFASIAAFGPTATLQGLHSGATTVRASLVVDDAGTTIQASAPITINAINDGTGTITIR